MKSILPALIVAASLLLPGEVNAQLQRGDGTLTLMATLVSDVDVDAAVQQEIEATPGLRAAVAVRDGKLRPRRGYRMYRAADRLIVRNDTGAAPRVTKVTLFTERSQVGIEVQICGCSEKRDDGCQWVETEDNHYTCEGEADGCCEADERFYGVYWVEE